MTDRREEIGSLVRAQLEDEDELGADDVVTHWTVLVGLATADDDGVSGSARTLRSQRGLAIHHAQYQRLKADVVKQQSVNVQNGRKGGRPRKPGREQASDLKPPKPSRLATRLANRQPKGTGQGGTGLDVRKRRHRNG